MYNIAVTIFMFGWLALSGSATLVLSKFIAAGISREKTNSQSDSMKSGLRLVWSGTVDGAIDANGAETQPHLRIAGL